MYTCASCVVHACKSGKIEDAPSNCPCTKEELNQIKKLYDEGDNHKIAYASALVESEGYCKRTRVEEIMEFARKCDYNKIGLAFCVGLANEGKILNKILTYNGFEVSSIICKNGGVPKEFIGIKDEEKVCPGGFEPMCNPIGQAIFLNNEKTDLNVLLGLCVGHDSLFLKYSKAPVTVFAVKDRVLGHNPLAAIYQADAYYKSKLFPKKANNL